MQTKKNDTPQRLKIGWASRDISTNQPVDIPGQFHIRVSKGVLDPITTTALVIDNAGKTLFDFQPQKREQF